MDQEWTSERPRGPRRGLWVALSATVLILATTSAFAVGYRTSNRTPDTTPTPTLKPTPRPTPHTSDEEFSLPQYEATTPPPTLTPACNPTRHPADLAAGFQIAYQDLVGRNPRPDETATLVNAYRTAEADCRYRTATPKPSPELASETPTKPAPTTPPSSTKPGKTPSAHPSPRLPAPLR